MKKIILISLFVIAVVLVLNIFGINSNVFGAEGDVAKIYLKVPSTPIAPKSQFSVTVLLDAGNPVNAFDIEINFPKDKLKFISFNNTNSVVDLWQTKPTILPNGNLGFSGGIIKSFQGVGGLVGIIFFEAVSTGVPQASFTKSDFYISDGKGTKIVAEAGSGTLAIRDDGKVLSASIIPFQDTSSDILVEEGLQTFKSNKLFKNISILLTILVVVIGAFLVYNKYKRHRSN